MRRVVVLAVVVAVCFPVVATTGVATGASPVAGNGSTQEATVTIPSIDVVPTAPFVGETVTVTPTVRNEQSSRTNVTVEAVTLYTGDGERRLDRVDDLGRLPPGASVEVPLDVRFDAGGYEQLRVVVDGETGDGTDVRLERPVSVRVIDDHPDVRVIPPNESVAGVDARFRVRVENGFDRHLRSVDVSLRSRNVSFQPASDGQPRLAAGDTARFTFSGRSDDPGVHTVDARVRYRTTTGYRRTVTRSARVAVEPLEESVTLVAPDPPEGNVSVPVTVGNFGNAPIENVVVRAEASNGTVTPVTIDEVPADSVRRVTLAVSGVDSRATLDITAEYEIGGRVGTATATSRVVDTVDVPGEVELTGLEVRREGDRLRITGSASNVGLEEVNSVVVRVRDTERVTPAAPNREFFVGTIPASDFVSFDVYARTDGNVTAIPLEVTYLADGERTTVQARAPVEGVATGQSSDEPASEPDPLVYGMGGVVVLAVTGLLVVGWRNRGG